MSYTATARRNGSPQRLAATARRNGSPQRLAATARVEGGITAFNASLLPSVPTRSSTDVPDKLYNLEIRQYDVSGNHLTGKDYGTVDIGKSLEVTLQEAEDCQLVLVARGSGPAVSVLGTKTLEAVQSMIVNSSVINAIDPSVANSMNAMPYVLHLKHVKVATVNGVPVIQSPDGSYDARLMLKRLATRLTVTWNYKVAGYKLKQLLIQSVPMNYAIVDKPETDGTYPSIVSQFTTLAIPISEDDASKGEGSYSCWVPANVRGESAAATTETQRTKANAPVGSTFFNFVAVNDADTKKKLDYRVYIGSGASTDFNMYRNKDYAYAVNFAHAGIPTDDNRVTYIDPIPASENNDNLVPTANCFMVEPGGAFCFDPFKYRQKGADIENSSLVTWAQKRGGIAYVKLLWQTHENGDVGDPVIGIVNSATDHGNIVEALKIGDRTPLGKENSAAAADQCRIYCRVSPAAKGGGNGMIAAYDANDAILWSWHIWVTDYNPDATGNETVLEPSTKRKQKYAYRNDISSLPMMDRNLGALEGYTSVPADEIAKSRTNGLHYQWGRKDPFLGSYTTKSINSVAIVSGSAAPTDGLQNAYGPDGYTFFPRSSTTTFSGDKLEYSFKIPTTVYDRNISAGYVTEALWGANESVPKTLYDPCPQGWRVPAYTAFLHLFSGAYAGTTSATTDDNVALRSVPASGDTGYDDYWKKGAGAGIYKDGGVLIKYDATDHATYYRFTGYQEFVNAFNYIGLFSNIWVLGNFSKKRGYGFSVNWGASLNSGAAIYARLVGAVWNVADAQNVRCIQEKE